MNMNCNCTETVSSDSQGNCTECGGNLVEEVEDLIQREGDLTSTELKIFTRAQTLKGQVHALQDEIAFLESFLPAKYREKIKMN